MLYRTGGGIGYTGMAVHYPAQKLSGAILVNIAEFEGRWDILQHVLAPYLEGEAGR